MRDSPNCKICKLKCRGCSFRTCVIYQQKEGWDSEDCRFMASKYHLFDMYMNSSSMKLCIYQEVCKSVAVAWGIQDNG